MDPRYRIQRADPDHLGALQGVERAAARSFDAVDVTLDLDDVTPLPAFRRAQAEGLLWVALDPVGAVAGFALVGRSTEHPRAHLVELDVHPDHGRKGIGRALVETVCAWARDAGLDAVTLTTFRHVPWNGPWYQRIGFEALADDQLDDELRRVLRAEAEEGLDPAQRVAMRRPLR